MNLAEEFQQIAVRLRELFPESQSGISLTSYPSHVEIGIHGIPDYATGTRIMQRLGIGERDKQVHNDSRPWCVLSGNLSPDVSVTTYCGGLPPSCKIVTEFRKVPKQQTIDSGEFIEVPQTRIVCGEVEA